MIAAEGIALECFNCGSVTLVSFDLPEQLPPPESVIEVAVTCDLCNRTQWMTLTMKAKVDGDDG